MAGAFARAGDIKLATALQDKAAKSTNPNSRSVSICISGAADALQQRAATDLQRYLKQLFGLNVRVANDSAPNALHRFVIGLSSAPHVRQVASHLPMLSKQGHIVRRVNARTMILAGGSSAAVAWAVYELLERYGVRYLLHEDVIPENADAFHLPALDLTFEPVQKIRSWRQFNVLPFGPMMWSLEQQRTFINQLFKLKFNGIYLNIWPQHPLVDYRIGGIRKTSWGLLFPEQIPINRDNIGRENLWPDMPVLTNPEFRGVATFDEALVAGRRLFNGILDHAQSLEMHTCIGFQPMNFPSEFCGILANPTQPFSEGPIQLCAETADLNNPKHVRAIEATFRAYAEQWGRVNEFQIAMPEHPYADRAFRRAWQSLATKFSLEPEYQIDELLTGSQKRSLNAGGVARGQRELKSAVSMLQFFDEFFSGNDLLKQLRSKSIDLTLVLGNSSEQVLPFIHRVLPPGCGVRTSVDYTSSRAVRRLELLEKVNTSKIRATLVVTLQDDNVGWLPQVATDNLHLLLQALHRNGWEGFYTRYWPIGDLDPATAYLARASWDANVSPRATYADHFQSTYGPAATEILSQVMRMLEDATVVLDLDFLSLAFPVPGSIWARQANRPMAEGLFHVLATYESVRRLLQRVRDLPGPKVRNSNLAYWIGRLTFAIQLLEEIRLLHEGKMALEATADARKEGKRSDASAHLGRAASAYEAAVAAGESALVAMAAHVRDDSDRGAIAAYYHYMVREVRAKAREVVAAEKLQD
jgi:hypothetical protein